MSAPVRLTAAQRDALHWLAGRKRGAGAKTPRDDVLKRLVGLGLARGYVHCWTNYRSERTHSQFECTGLTDAGRAAL